MLIFAKLVCHEDYLLSYVHNKVKYFLVDPLNIELGIVFLIFNNFIYFEPFKQLKALHFVKITFSERGLAYNANIKE